MKCLHRLVLVLWALPALCLAWTGPDLSGLWSDDVGGQYRIRQSGNTLVWFDDRSPLALNVFVGTINGNAIDGQWWDLPGGQLSGSGRLSLRIESGDRMVKTGSNPAYGGSVISRIGSRGPGPGGGGGTGGTSPAQALGCFKDTGDRDLPSAFWTDERMTVGACLARCAQQGFGYAGVQYGNQCFCGNAYGRFGPASNCDMRCSGNANEICGGYWANSIFRTAAPQTAVPQTQPLGCFKDTNDRDLPSGFWSDDRMTVGACAARCAQQGFSYAGVQYGSQCFCGNSYGRFGPANNCDTRCSGNANEICGGTWANSIYRIAGGGTPPRPDGGGLCADPRTQGVMDEWLAAANPPENANPGWSVRYDAWARLVGRTPTAIITGLPPGVDTPLSRCEYLWSVAPRRNSTNLGTLQSYVSARVR